MDSGGIPDEAGIDGGLNLVFSGAAEVASPPCG
jgi:hypothetical protein